MRHKVCAPKLIAAMTAAAVLLSPASAFASEVSSSSVVEEAVSSSSVVSSSSETGDETDAQGENADNGQENTDPADNTGNDGSGTTDGTDTPSSEDGEGENIPDSGTPDTGGSSETGDTAEESGQNSGQAEENTSEEPIKEDSRSEETPEKTDHADNTKDTKPGNNTSKPAETSKSTEKSTAKDNKTTDISKNEDSEKETDIAGENDKTTDIEEKADTTEKDAGVDEKAIKQAEEEAAKKPEEERTNKALIASQNIQHIAPIEEDWRMYQVEAETLYAAGDICIYEEASSDARVVGVLAEVGLAYRLSDKGEGWLYVESGKVRGFAKADGFYSVEEGSAAFTEYKEHLTDIFSAIYQGEALETFAESIQASSATALIPPEENAATAYMLCTAINPVAVVPAISDADGLTIRESKGIDNRVVGRLQKGNLVYVLERAGDWAFVESGEVRGYVSAKRIRELSEEEKNAFSASDYETAEVIVPQDDNAAWWGSIRSIKEGSKDAALRKAILEYAQQFVGNPYVWGGNSLTNGCDCSGFVKLIYAHFGITLPRVADDQSRVGKPIPTEDASPGDLVFFARNGYVYHVAMYAGNGETIEARSEQYGIVHMKRDINAQCVWATRLL